MLKKLSAVLGAGLLAAAMWIWVQDISIPHQQAEAVARETPRGNLSDLYPRWLGARELLLHGRNPYSAEVTREIQTGYYGRPLDRNRPNDPKDQQAFAYPVYVVFLLAPTVGLPFAIVQRMFLWLLVAATALSLRLWLRAIGWRLSIAAEFVWIILTLGCFPAIQGFKLQQLTLVVAALLAASMYSLAHRCFVWSGILLAFASIKPQLVLLVVVWLGIWVMGNWRDRQRLLWSFVLSMAVLVIAGEFLLPGWISEFRVASTAYYRYTGGGMSVLDVELTPLWGRMVAAIVVGAVLLLISQVRRTAEGTPDFHWSLALVLATTLLVIPMFAPYNQLLLVPTLMVIVRAIRPLWQGRRLSRFFVVATAVSVLWPWVAAASLSMALLFLPGALVQRAWAVPLFTTFAIPVTVLALVLVSRSAVREGNSAGGGRAEASTLR